MIQRRLFVGLLSVLSIVGGSIAGRSQTTEPKIEGNWEETLTAGQAQLRMRFEISKASAGLYLGNLYVADRPRGVRADRLDVTGTEVRNEVGAGRAVFTGDVDGDRGDTRGSWTEGGMTHPRVS
jgi:hypothetical protein